MQLELECDMIDAARFNVEQTESRLLIEPVVFDRLEMQTSASKGESDFRLGWGVEGLVKGAAELTYGLYSVVLLMTRSTTPPNLAEVAALTTLPKTAAPRSSTSDVACTNQCGMRATIK